MLAKAHWEDRSGEQSVKYTPGDEIPDDHPKREWLLHSGIAVATSEVAEVVDDAEPETSQETPAVEPEPAPEGGPARPKQAASTEDWRDYGESMGVNTKGLSKQQIIAATREK